MRRAELTAVFGMLCVGAGVWWIYPPASLILAGLLLFAIGLGELRRREP